jgi:hypothetical protein
MFMRKNFQTLRYIIFSAALGAALFSCTDIEHGVFWSIEHEEKTPDNSLPNDIGVYGMITVPKIPGYASQAAWPQDRYYLAGGALFFRNAAPNSEWKKISTPGTGGIVNDVTYIDTGTSIEIYVSVMYGNSGVLYRLDENQNPGYTIPDPAYTPPPPPEPPNPPRIPDPAGTYTMYAERVWTGRQIQRLVSIDTNADGKTDEFFASAGTRTNNPYQFWYFSWDSGSGSMRSQETGLGGEIVTGGAFDGSAYWFVSRAHVFKVDSAATLTSFSESVLRNSVDSETWKNSIVWEITAGPSFNGSNPVVFNLPDLKLSRFEDIFYDQGTPPPLSGVASPNYSSANSNPNLYIACANGLFMTTTANAAAWDRLSGGHYTGIVKILNNATAPTVSRLVAGREDSGLVEFEMRTLADGVTKEPYAHRPYGRYGDFPSLYNASITRVLANGTVLIAGTTRSGAWNGDYSSGIQSPYWSQE